MTTHHPTADHPTADHPSKATRGEEGLEARLAAVHAQLAASVATLASSDGWRRMLTVAARFHRYSPNNVLLIAMQAPEATVVAGYRSWAQLGRQVRRGERGIAILAPVVRRADPAQENTADPVVAGNDDRDAPSRVLHGFRVTHVFDIGQTDGKPLPDCRPSLLAGGSPAGLWDRLAAQVHAAGFTLDRGDCGAANGYTDHHRRQVRVRADVSPAQAVKTLAHELAHVLQDGPDQPTRPRHLSEVEAESVAYLVTAAAGLPSDAYSVPYVAGWAGGDAQLLGQTATRVLATARSIIDRAGPPTDPLTVRLNPFQRTRALPAADLSHGRDGGLSR